MVCAISGIDHVAVTVTDLDAAVAFYSRVLGAEVGWHYEHEGRVIIKQLRMGGAMLNLHQAGHGLTGLIAATPTPGAVDLCFRWSTPIADAVAHLNNVGVEIEGGPAERYASDGKAGMSVYFRDLDGNLLEFLTTVEGGARPA
jgi:catechol 2,3-dioxygenase-like lactoylglutathione lyase family enzyme